MPLKLFDERVQLVVDIVAMSLMCGAACAIVTMAVCEGVEAGFFVAVDAIHMLPEPEPWVPAPEEVPEPAGEPVFEELLRQIPKPESTPFYVPRGQGSDRNWPSGFYRDPEPDPPSSEATPEPQPEPPFITIPKPNVDCEPAVFLVDEMRWTCLDQEMDAPATIEPPLLDDTCTFRYCGDETFLPHHRHVPVIGVF